MKVLAAALCTVMIISAIGMVNAHKTTIVGNYQIEVGWMEEPPLAGQKNAITFSIQVDEGGGVSSPVTNAFRDLTANIKSGSLTKSLDVLSDVKPGHYYAKIIPTKVGTLTVELKGKIKDTQIDEQINIEDVENIDLLAFPPTGVSGQSDVAQLKNALISIQKDVSELKSGSTKFTPDLSKSYDLVLFALGLGAAGVILSVISMIKRK